MRKLYIVEIHLSKNNLILFSNVPAKVDKIKLDLPKTLSKLYLPRHLKDRRCIILVLAKPKTYIWIRQQSHSQTSPKAPWNCSLHKQRSELIAFLSLCHIGTKIIDYCTIPASVPLIESKKLQRLCKILAINRVVTPAAEPLMVVLKTAKPTSFALLSASSATDPALNAKRPNIKQKPPNAVN